MATLLCVDDNSQRLQAVTAHLRLAGYEVLGANDGATALEIFAKKRVDLAVVDYYMHGMGGDLVALEMKRLRSDVPVVIFSGTFTLPEMVIALVDGFVFTGEDPHVLTEKIAKLLHQRKLHIHDSQQRTKGAA